MDETRMALDVWLKFADDDDEESEYEANTFKAEGLFCVEYYHTAIGLVSRKGFDTYAECETWYLSQGFRDFSS